MEFARELAAALAAVHDADVLHRDVKPSNVLVEDGHPVLIDVGIAQLTDDSPLTMAGWMLGTPGYLAPEALHGAPPSAAGDVHGWAATVVYAATGECPFGAGSVEAIIERVRRSEYVLPELPTMLRTLVVEVLRAGPSRRPTAPELAGRSAGRGSTVADPDPSPPDRPIRNQRPPPTRRRTPEGAIPGIG